MNEDRVNLLISEMKRKRLSSRYDKKKMALSPQQLSLNIFKDEMITDDIKEIVDAVTLHNQFPTVEVLRIELRNAIEMIYEHHNNGNSVLKHNCCFEEYIQKILMLVDVMISKGYIYSHKFVKGYMGEVKKNGK